VAPLYRQDVEVAVIAGGPSSPTTRPRVSSPLPRPHVDRENPFFGFRRRSQAEPRESTARLSVASPRASQVRAIFTFESIILPGIDNSKLSLRP
jgi:hypothetical protein